MKTAFALIGLAVLIILGSLYFFTDRAPISAPLPLENDNKTPMLTLSSPAFVHNGSIPSEYTCDGRNTNPELHISNAPEGTQSFALTMEDPDIPEEAKDRLGVDIIDHWVVFNIPATTTVIAASSTPPGVVGMGLREQKYMGPCPPDREHRYFFKLYALDQLFGLEASTTKRELLDAIEGHVLGEAELIGRYVRASTSTPQ